MYINAFSYLGTTHVPACMRSDMWLLEEHVGKTTWTIADLVGQSTS